MENININKILNREEKANSIKDILTNFSLNKHDLLVKKGIYIYGEPGSGKTTFITKILNELNYDIINYDAGDVRNKSVIDDITKNNMSDKNIMSLFNKKVKNIAIIMDEIDGMNNGDKGGINTLIKLIRPKKTKKQKQEEVTMNPIICIGNYRIDKKIKELMKVCNVVELKIPTHTQILNIINSILPNINISIKHKIIDYVQGDLRKLNNIYNIYKQKPELILNNMIENIFQLKSYSDDTKKITNKLFMNNYSMSEHINIMNETDRTSVGLLWHENIIDLIEKMNKKDSIPFYIEQLENICLADYIDRVTFQKQIWQFNEMSSLIKIFKNNKHFHKYFTNKIKNKIPEIRFTKVLTKYSTEYNNYIFIQNLCQQLGMEKKDMYSFFIELREKMEDVQAISLFENYEITKLDINRIYRYLEKYITENAKEIADKDIDLDGDVDFEFTTEDIYS
jgi:SpoVK/Ycf46/Vps4 family AAA+-type ATPase